jgi:RimJ/RimL family protein N-acetyltransferase
MQNDIRFIPASSLSLESFATLFSHSFENYFYPIILTSESFATRVRLEQLDLHCSVVMLLDDTPVGQATLGLRGDKAWCGGFGIVPEQRGKHFAPALLDELIRQARDAGAKSLTLEVLQVNKAAQHLYAKAGLQHRRDLLLLEWKRGDTQAKQETSDSVIMQSVNMAEIISHFYRLHPTPPAWQRDLARLILQRSLSQLNYIRDDELQGYVLFTIKDDIARINDLGSSDVNIAKILLTNLQMHYKEIYSVNEPSDSPITAAYDTCGFREYDRQYELVMDL